MTIRFKTNFLENYLRVAPLALAIERSFECEILSRQVFESPVLDIGCGDGVFASVLFADPIDLGIDLDAAEVERARGRGCYHELLSCPGNLIPRGDESFRTIFSNSALEHIEKIDAVLTEAHRLLAPVGRFYITVPSHQFDRYSFGCRLLSACGLEGTAAVYSRFYNRFWRHYHFYRPEVWRALFAKAGFRVVNMQEYCPRNVCTLNDILAPFGATGLLTKKLTGHWILFPCLRRVYASAINQILKRRLRVDSTVTDGGILFFCLERQT